MPDDKVDNTATEPRRQAARRGARHRQYRQVRPAPLTTPRNCAPASGGPHSSDGRTVPCRQLPRRGGGLDLHVLGYDAGPDALRHHPRSHQDPPASLREAADTSAAGASHSSTRRLYILPTVCGHCRTRQESRNWPVPDHKQGPDTDLQRRRQRPTTHHMVHDPAFQADGLMLDSLCQPGVMGADGGSCHARRTAREEAPRQAPREETPAPAGTVDRPPHRPPPGRPALRPFRWPRQQALAVRVDTDSRADAAPNPVE